jgi:CRP/FNR family cyclic AMP-dependent transcriptional regulator
LSSVKAVPLFATATEEQLAGMVPQMQHRSYRARTCIVRAGEIADGLHVILSGQVKLLVDDGDGHQAILAVLGANDFFGEVGLIDDGPRFADVYSQQDCEILYIPREVLFGWLETDCRAAVSLLRTVTARLAEAQRKIVNLALVDVYGRVARLLLDTGLDMNGEWLVQAGSEQIASMVGASREMVSRVVKDMITRGVVRRHKRKLIVLDRASLMQRTTRPKDTPMAYQRAPSA